MDVVKPVLAVVLAATLIAPAGSSAMSKADAKRLARAVNLKPADMPGFDATPPDPSGLADDRRGNDQLARCVGATPTSRAIADVQSSTFVKGDLGSSFEVSGSETRVYRNARAVRKDLRALRGARTRTCLHDLVLKSASEGATVVAVTVDRLNTGVSGVVGYRVKTELDPSDRRNPLYSDIFFMGTRAVESIVILNTHPDPPSQGHEDRLVNIVKTRLTAQADPNRVI